MFQETFIVQLTDLCPLSMYAFVHVYTILGLGLKGCSKTMLFQCCFRGVNLTKRAS